MKIVKLVSLALLGLYLFFIGIFGLFGYETTSAVNSLLGLSAIGAGVLMLLSCREHHH